MGPSDLTRLLSVLPPVNDPRVLIGRLDDAAVFRLSDELAIVQTVDFITPVVDDPFTFGQIAAANALSDIYAMGAKPSFALNLVGFPGGPLPLSLMEDILRGGAEKAGEAGVSIIGGHSVTDHAIKFGMAISGLVHPDRIVTRNGARAGDALVLTKPLGSGVITTALDQGLAGADGREAVKVMASLNEAAGAAMVSIGVDACVDVTGFGLLGHLHEMLAASVVAARIDYHRVPVLKGAEDLVQAGAVSGGTQRNALHYGPHVEWAGPFSKAQQVILADAQTSGGLLMAVSPDRVEALLQEMARLGAEGFEIGEVITGKPGYILVGS